MGSTLPPEELELYQRIDEVLHYLWDPIGIAGNPHARDEYQSYVPGIFSLVQAGADASAIATHLDRIAQGRMGLGSNPAHSLKAAESLLKWKAKITQRPE